MANTLSDFSQLKHSMFKAKKEPIEIKPEPHVTKQDDNEEVLAYFGKSTSKVHILSSVEEPDGDNDRIAELEDEMAAKDEILAELAAEKVSAEDRLMKTQEELAESKNKISRLENEIAQLKAKQAREEKDSPRSPENAAVADSAQGRVNAQEDEKKPTRALLEASLAIEEVFLGELREIVLSVLKEGCEIAQNAGRERRAALLSQLLVQNTPSRELDSRKNELRQILKDAGSFADVHTIRALEKIGFRLISGKKHWKLEYGNVRMPIAKTPSDYRSNLNSANAIASKCF